MATENELIDIQRALNKVQSAAQVRIAIGAALNALGATYPALERISNDDLERSMRGQMDSAGNNLNRWLKQIFPTGSEDYRAEWQKGRHLVDTAYVVIAGVEGAANWKPRTSFWSILLTSLEEAPKVFGEGVGSVVGAAGKAAGQAAAGVGLGLGLSGWIFVIVVGLVVLTYVNRGTVIGRVGRLVGVS